MYPLKEQISFTLRSHIIKAIIKILQQSIPQANLMQQVSRIKNMFGIKIPITDILV